MALAPLQIRAPVTSADAAAVSLRDLAALTTFEFDYSLDESARELGRGTHATVRACTHRASGERRAAKIIDMRRFRLAQSFRVSTLLDEVRILRSLNHANVIRVFEVYDCVQSPEAVATSPRPLESSTAALSAAPSPAPTAAVPADSVVVVMELAPGGELFESIISAGNFSEPQACHVVWQVLRALEHLHERDIVHRDIKPENLLVFGTDFVNAHDPVVRPGHTYRSAATLTEAPGLGDATAVASPAAAAAILPPPAVPMLRVKLADFGVARYVGAATHAAGASTVVGSAHYMAPEVLARGAGRWPSPTGVSASAGAGTSDSSGASASSGATRRGYGCAVDVYSLGVVLYVMLAGQMPFDEHVVHSAEARQVLLRLQREQGGMPLSREDRVRHGAFFFSPPIWTHISEAAKTVIRGMMATDPAARLTVQQAMALPWFDAVRAAEAGGASHSPQGSTIGSSVGRAISFDRSGRPSIASPFTLSPAALALTERAQAGTSALEPPLAAVRRAEEQLATHGPALEVLALAGGIGAAAFLALSEPLRPADLCEAFVAGLDGAAADPTADPPKTLLSLVRCVIDSLNASSRLSNAESTGFLQAALRAGLYGLVFADVRATFVAAEHDLCDASVAAYERACKRAVQTVTRSSKWGEQARTIYSLGDGTPLVSFALFKADDAALIEDFVRTLETEPLPVPLFGLYSDTCLRPGEAPRDAAAATRALLGERLTAACSVAFIAARTVGIDNRARGLVPAPGIARISAALAGVSMTPREFDGLFLSFGRHRLGITALAYLAFGGGTSPAFESMLDPRVNGFARVLGALSAPLDDFCTEHCLMLLATVCCSGGGVGERSARALVDGGAFVLLQPVILHTSPLLALRAAFALACVAVSCRGADEPLLRSGALDAIARALSPLSIGAVLIPGHFALTNQLVTLLQSGVAPALQLAALQRLGASVSGPEVTANIAAAKAAHVLAALRGCAAAPDAVVAAAATTILAVLSDAGGEGPRAAADPGWLDLRPDAPASSRAASDQLASHGRSLEALSRAGGTGAAAALARMPLLGPQVLSDTFAAGLEGVLADPAAVPPRALLELARGALDALNASSHAGSTEAAAFVAAALRHGLYSHVFADARAARDAAESDLRDATVSACERACERAGLAVTRPVAATEILRTVFTLPDGTPLHSAVLVAPEGDAALLQALVLAFEAEPSPTSAFRLYVDTRPRDGERATDGCGTGAAAAAERARLGERVLAAASRAYIASFTVLTQSYSLGNLPAPIMARLRFASSAFSLSPRELEDLVATFGRDQVGLAVLSFAAVVGASSPIFEALASDSTSGLALLLDALSSTSAALDEPSTIGCLVILSFACTHSPRCAQLLIDKGAFLVLQPAIRHKNPAIAVRAAFAVAFIADSGRGSEEKLLHSGALEAIDDSLRAINIGTVALSGFFATLVPLALRLLQPGVHPALQLAALHRLGAGFSDPRTASIAAASKTAPLVDAVRSAAASHDAFVYSAAIFVLKALGEPLPHFHASMTFIESARPFRASSTPTASPTPTATRPGSALRLAPLSFSPISVNSSPTSASAPASVPLGGVTATAAAGFGSGAGVRLHGHVRELPPIHARTSSVSLPRALAEADVGAASIGMPSAISSPALLLRPLSATSTSRMSRDAPLVEPTPPQARTSEAPEWELGMDGHASST